MANAKRDRQKEDALRAAGWAVFTVWECDIRDEGDWLSPITDELRKHTQANSCELALLAGGWLNSPDQTGDIAGEEIRD